MQKESLYIVEFDSGVIKVGKGVNPKSRIKSHEATGKIAGWKIKREFKIECVGLAHCPEIMLINFAASKSSEIRCREWFLGVDFDQLVEKATEFSKLETKKNREKKGGLAGVFKNLFFMNESKGFDQCLEIAEQLISVAISDIEELQDIEFFQKVTLDKNILAIYMYETSDFYVFDKCEQNGGEINVMDFLDLYIKALSFCLKKKQRTPS